MRLEIDVSGDDLLNKDFVVCIADNNGIIKGFKFPESLIKVLSSRYGQEFYRYKKSRKGKALFKIRIYSIIVYSIIKIIKPDKELNLKICRDFDGKEQEIKNNLKFFLEEQLGLNCNFEFAKLEKDSHAHHYSYLMRKDKKNQLKSYVSITLEEIEKWLKK
jgi:hypothetical protein